MCLTQGSGSNNDSITLLIDCRQDVRFSMELEAMYLLNQSAFEVHDYSHKKFSEKKTNNFLMILVSLNFDSEEVDIIHAGKQLVESDYFFKATF